MKEAYVAWRKITKPIPRPIRLRDMKNELPEELWELRKKYEKDLQEWCEEAPFTIGFLRGNNLQILSPAFGKDLREQIAKWKNPLEWRVSYFFRRNLEEPWEASGHSLFRSKMEAVKECRSETCQVVS